MKGSSVKRMKHRSMIRYRLPRRGSGLRSSATSGVKVAHGLANPVLVVPCLDEETDDRGLTERAACLQAVQTFDQDEPLSVPTNQDRRGLAVLQHALSDFVNRLGIEGLATLHRDIDLVDFECLVLQHDGSIRLTARMLHRCKGFSTMLRVGATRGSKQDAPCRVARGAGSSRQPSARVEIFR